MRKFLYIILLVSMFHLPCFAEITTDEAISQTYIQTHGHSDEMSRLIDLQNAQINCERTKYRSNNPAWYSDKKVNFIRQVFIYFDPGLDDEKFGNHSIQYTNRYNSL